MTLTDFILCSKHCPWNRVHIKVLGAPYPHPQETASDSDQAFFLGALRDHPTNPPSSKAIPRVTRACPSPRTETLLNWRGPLPEHYNDMPS